MIRLLVYGGRTYDDRRLLFNRLDQVHRYRTVALVIEGGARGADRLARGWAVARGVPFLTFEADWATHGRSAGARRNQRMLVDGAPDLAVEFPGGAGTADMRRRLTSARIAVLTGEQAWLDV